MSAEDITIGIGLVIVLVLFVTSAYAEHKERVRKGKEQIHHEAQLEELSKELREARAEVKRLSNQ